MKKLLKNTTVQILLGLIVLALITWGSISVLSNHAENLSSATVIHKDITEQVSAIGEVKPEQDVTLAFDMQGKIASTYVDVGSVVTKGQALAALSSGTLSAQLDGAQADLAAAEARLADMKDGARPEEVALYEQKYNDASSALRATLKSVYLQTEDALIGKSDTIFTNGDTANPVINVPTNSQSQQTSIQNKRIALHDQMSVWKNSLAGTGSLESIRDVSVTSLTMAKSFLDDLAVIVNNLTPGNSGQTQSVIDGERSVVNAAGQEVSGAILSEQGSNATWSSARDALTLERAGSTANTLAAQEAAVEKAQAVVSGIETQLSHSVITAPFDGIVTRMDLKIGEVYVPGISANKGIGLMTNSAYNVEIYVPETDVAKLSVGNAASVTLDAYGSDTIFPAKVSLIDPAQTIQDGVGAYKVTIRFDTADSRIKSGMTANVSVVTKSVPQALVVPSSAIVTKGIEHVVLVEKGRSFVQQKVTVGITSTDGFTEILSGVGENDTVATFGTNY